MAEEFEGDLVVDPKQPAAPPYRPHRDRPTGPYIQWVVDQIAETGEPEKIVGLYRGKIDRNAKFRKLREIHINRKKRPNGDMAPCPRCGYDDKFLEGAFAWFPDLQCCAVIGHCCASHEALNEAEREFKWRQKRDYEENYLLEGLPKLALKAQLLGQLRPPSEEALRVYRQFKKEAPAVHRHFRDLKSQRGGELKLYQIISSAEEESDYVGPAGFRGRGGSETQSRDIDFGIIAGQTAVSHDFHPIRQLDHTLRVLDSFAGRPTEEEALELIVNMEERHRRAAVAILQGVDRGYAKLAEMLNGFWAFFTRSNIARLHDYGTHPENHFPFEAKYRVGQGRTLVTFTHRRVDCRLSFAEKFASFTVVWPD